MHWPMGKGPEFMPKRNPRKTQRHIYATNIKKLQRAGLIGDVDLRAKATPGIVRKLEKYKSVLVGKSSAVKAPDLATARRLRKTLGLGGTGTTIIVPREKGERYKVKASGEIVSTRPGYNKGETITKTVTRNFPLRPAKGKRLYYTVPAPKGGKRTTFASFDELLFYMSKYSLKFDDFQDRLEVEEITRGGRADKRRIKTMREERAAAVARYKRRGNKRKGDKRRKPRGKR